MLIQVHGGIHRLENILSLLSQAVHVHGGIHRLENLGNFITD